MENIKKLIENPLKNINLTVDEVKFVKGNPSTLNITLDSEDIINIDKIVEATNIISPLLDGYNFIDDSYVLDVSSKEKGGQENEQ